MAAGFEIRTRGQDIPLEFLQKDVWFCRMQQKYGRTLRRGYVVGPPSRPRFLPVVGRVVLPVVGSALYARTGRVSGLVVGAVAPHYKTSPPTCRRIGQ